MGRIDPTSRKILAARKRAGNECTTCPTCGRPPSTPHRRIVAGRITEGCVDAAHSGHLAVPSNSGEWHTRKAAHKIRQATLAALDSRARD